MVIIGAVRRLIVRAGTYIKKNVMPFSGEIVVRKILVTVLFMDLLWLVYSNYVILRTAFYINWLYSKCGSAEFLNKCQNVIEVIRGCQVKTQWYETGRRFS
jgi:hypothetical protein